jgi:hypothetical protein
MAKWWIIALLALTAPVVMAGDEDVKQEAPVVQPKPPEAIPIPAEPEAPDMSLEEEEPEPAPEFSPVQEPAPPVKKSYGKRKSPDKNMDYSEILDEVQALEASRGVLPPALGSRGYRPNMIAVGYGDRTPGYGAMVEYSWNRLGAGVYYSYRNLKDADLYSYSQGFGGLYFLYRWLPFKFSPYILGGLEAGSKTAEAFGGTLGLGMEVQVYYGWTLLLGYTFHSTARKGFMGGAIGWAF